MEETAGESCLGARVRLRSRGHRSVAAGEHECKCTLWRRVARGGAQGSQYDRSVTAEEWEMGQTWRRKQESMTVRFRRLH